MTTPLTHVRVTYVYTDSRGGVPQDAERHTAVFTQGGWRESHDIWVFSKTARVLKVEGFNPEAGGRNPMSERFELTDQELELIGHALRAHRDRLILDSAPMTLDRQRWGFKRAEAINELLVKLGEPGAEFFKGSTQ